jgi:hypothetical protein
MGETLLKQEEVKRHGGAREDGFYSPKRFPEKIFIEMR